MNYGDYYGAYGGYGAYGAYGAGYGAHYGDQVRLRLPRRSRAFPRVPPSANSLSRVAANPPVAAVPRSAGVRLLARPGQRGRAMVPRGRPRLRSGDLPPRSSCRHRALQVWSGIQDREARGWPGLLHTLPTLCSQDGARKSGAWAGDPNLDDGIPVCMQYRRGHCTYGDRCKYRHEGAPGGMGMRPKGAVADDGTPICIQFRQGNCTYGARCKYKHEDAPAGEGRAWPGLGR